MSSYTIANTSTGTILGTYAVPASLRPEHAAVVACCEDAGYTGTELDAQVQKMMDDENIIVSPAAEGDESL